MLYNKRYGGFGFSKAFACEYEARHPEHKSITWCSRSDELAVQIFREKGSQWCSGKYAELDLYEVPTILLPYVDLNEYDGKETPMINFYEGYGHILVKYMQGELTENEMKQQYELIRAHEQIKD